MTPNAPMKRTRAFKDGSSAEVIDETALIAILEARIAELNAENMKLRRERANA